MPMRLPDEFKNCVTFLGTRERDGTVRFRGTGFLVGYPVPNRKDLYHTYLATAAHNVRNAANSGLQLVARYNTSDARSQVVDTTTDWYFHSDDAVDLAVLPIDIAPTYQIDLVPIETFATDELLKAHDFGTGDEIMAMGLFFFRHGRVRNLPVVRTGIVASMPDEPFVDDVTGKPYDAYLLEMRSFGGLSGTPVFTIIHRGSLINRPGRVFSSLVHQLTLVGVVRGHWDLQANRSSGNEIEQANLGLTIATPAQQLTSLLHDPGLVRLRRKEEGALPPDNAPPAV